MAVSEDGDAPVEINLADWAPSLSMYVAAALEDRPAVRAYLHEVLTTVGCQVDPEAGSAQCPAEVAARVGRFVQNHSGGRGD